MMKSYFYYSEDVCNKFLISYGKCESDVKGLVKNSLPLICDGNFFGFLTLDLKKANGIDLFYWSRVMGYSDWLYSIIPKRKITTIPTTKSGKPVQKAQLYSLLNKTSEDHNVSVSMNIQNINTSLQGSKSAKIGVANNTFIHGLIKNNKTLSKNDRNKTRNIFTKSELNLTTNNTVKSKDNVIQKMKKVGSLNDFLQNIDWEKLFAKRMEDIGLNIEQAQKMIDINLQESLFGRNMFSQDEFRKSHFWKRPSESI